VKSSAQAVVQMFLNMSTDPKLSPWAGMTSQLACGAECRDVIPAYAFLRAVGAGLGKASNAGCLAHAETLVARPTLRDQKLTRIVSA